MLDLLRIEKGQTVFELGAGSGWKVALMGQLVGPKGKVVSLEITSDLVQFAKSSIRELNLN